MTATHAAVQQAPAGPYDGIERGLVSSFITWSLAHGFTRALLHVAARRGDLLARMTVEQAMREDPFPAYEQLRARGPVARGRLISGTVSHPVANQVLRGDSFGVAAGHAELPAVLRRVLRRAYDPYALGPVDPPSLLAVDPPDHTRYRRLVGSAFTARRVAGMEERVTRVATRLLDDLEAEGAAEFDVVDRYASRLPVAVIADLLGIPDRLHARLLKLGNAAAVTLDPGLSWRQYRTAEHAVRELHHWFEDHVAALRRTPGDDLLSSLATMDGESRLSDVELRAVGLLLLGAGFETTVNLIGNSVVLLDRHHDQLRLLRAEPDRWSNAVEEVLRFDSPVQLTLRQAYADAELAGRPVAEGEAVLVYLGGANRDPEVFDDPQRFDVTRANADQHLAFSAGVHYCLGANLARLESAIGLRELHHRFPDLHVSATPVRRGTRVLRGYDRIPVGTARTKRPHRA